MARKSRGKLDDTLAAMFSNMEYRNSYLFYAHLIAQCSIKLDKTLPAAAGIAFHLDHYNLYINPDMFDEEPLLSRLGILKHEMLHILNGHVQRAEGRLHKPWNYATDCAINQLIDRDHLPDYAIYPDNLSEFLGAKVEEKLSSEDYFELLKDDERLQPPKKGDGESGDGDSQDGDGNGDAQGKGKGTPKLIDDHATWEESVGDKDLQQDLTKKMIEQSQNETIKGKGNVPSQCNDWLTLVTRKCEVNWKQVLRGIVGNKRVGRRSTIMRSDRRFPQRADLRGKLKDRTFNLLVIADVSGSMSDSAVLNTIAEVKNVCDITKTDADMIQIDTVAYTPEKLTKNMSLVNRKGNGGTTLSPALDMAREHNMDFQAVVVLTDGGLWGDDISHFKALNKKIIWLIEPNGYIMDEMNEGKMTAIKLKQSECE